MDKQTEELAIKTGIKTRLEKLERELLEISGVAGIRFYISDYEDIHYIIFLALYNIPVSAPNYYKLLGEMKIKVIETAEKYNLVKTEDRIEDYGDSLYFVFDDKNAVKSPI